MSANRWKKLYKQKNYRERGQSSDRAHLGLLEKKKDYLQRARDHHKKEDQLQRLRRDAAFKNPDEFYHGMIRSQRKGGKHISSSDDAPTLADQLELKTGDINYLTMKRTVENNKIDELKGRLHMLHELEDDELKAKHTVFVDTVEDAADFDEEEYFDTPKDLVTRAYNRPTRKMLEDGELVVSMPQSGAEVRKQEKQRTKSYEELAARMKRRNKIEETLDTLNLRRNLQKNTNVVKLKRAEQTVYKWRQRRQR